MSEKHIPDLTDGPKITENHWLSAAIAAAIITAILILIAFVLVFRNGFECPDKDLAAAVSPFGVALFALVTFCTVAWRGLVTTRQADYAAKQIEQSAAEQRAKLLQEGSRLLNDIDNVANHLAGLASLEVLITGEDEKFAIQAMSLIADFIQKPETFNDEYENWIYASQILAAGEELNRVAPRDITISNGLDNLKKVKIIKGIRRVKYYKSLLGYDSDKISKFTEYNIYDSQLSSVIYDSDIINTYKNTNINLISYLNNNNKNLSLFNDKIRFHNCCFSGFNIKNIKPNILINNLNNQNYKFIFCDFTGCIIDSSINLDNITLSYINIYNKNNPPKYDGDQEDFKKFLANLTEYDGDINS